MGLFDDLIPSGDSPGAMPPGGIPKITVRPPQPDYGEAISGIESGGNYRAVGPQTGKGRALGKYQVMDFNVGPWTEEVLGQRMSPEEYLSSNEAQDAVFKAKFGGYVQKYGPEGAAKAWFAGERGMNNPNARDVLGTTVSDYANKFNAATGGGRGQPAAQSITFDDLIPSAPVQERFAEPPQPTNATAMREGLNQRGLELTRGPQQSPAGQMATDFSNIVPAASQRTSPHISSYGGKLVSTETFENDAGDVLYRDPETGKIKTTDSKTQVAMRDPADGVVKVFSRSKDTDESAISGAARVATSGMLAGAPTARAMIPAAGKVQPVASDIMATAKPHYRAFKEAAGKIEIPAASATGIAERLRGSLEKANLIEELAKPVYAAVGILDKGQPLTLDALQNIKRVAGRSFASPDKNVRDAAAVVSGEISKIIGEVSPGAAASLKTGDEIYSASRSVQDLQRKSEVAKLRTGRAGYGGNAVNSMRQVLVPIVQKATEGRVTGFKPAEIQAMREIVEGTPATNAFRLMGQASPTKGVIPTGGAFGAAYALGPAGLAIPALGAVSNKLATILTGKQIDALRAMVAKRSPEYARAVAKAVDRYERAQIELMNKPSPNKLAAYLSAARALSAGLQKDGIAVSSGDLLRRLQSPVQGAAEPDQQPEPRPPGQ